MNYRPEGWKNPHADTTLNYAYNMQGLAFEAGADAMLEGLKKEGVYTYGNHTPDIELEDAPEVSGHWCFIPEEE